MLDFARGSRLATLIVALAGLGIAAVAFADDEDDVLAAIHQYGDLEGDLDAQAELMRDDRVHIFGGIRASDNAKNMMIQKAQREAGDAVNGGPSRIITTVESPQIAIHGNTAIASFVRTFVFFPHNQPPTAGAPTWVTLVFVKDGGDWEIAHTHQSPTRGN
jgi:hypothetical protein